MFCLHSEYNIVLNLGTD